MEDSISSERTARYRSYDIRTQVVGLIPPYMCAFTLTHSTAPNGERITRMCGGNYGAQDDAHEEATVRAKELIDLILAVIRT